MIVREDRAATFALTIRSAEGVVETLRATAEHPWYLADHVWVPTKALAVGDRLETATDADASITAIRFDAKPVQTYNFTVADTHTYLVGRTHVVVHNAPKVCEIVDNMFVDSTGKLHGDLPLKKDISKLSRGELLDLQSELEKSIAKRERGMRELGEQGGHGARLSSERVLLSLVNALLR